MSEFERQILDSEIERKRRLVDRLQEQFQQEKSVLQALMSIKNRGRLGTYPRQPKSR